MIARRWLSRLGRIVISLTLAVLLPLAAGAQDGEDHGATFPVSQINPGLPAPPDSVARDTPWNSMSGFLDAIDAGQADLARHYLDLSELSDEDQARLGGRLALQFGTVMRRKSVIDWSALPDRPDALDERLGSQNPRAGQARRSLLIAVVETDKGRPLRIRMNRVEAADGDPVWLFARQIVPHIPMLYELYGPSRFERALPEVMHREAVMGLAWWELIGIPAIAALAALLAWMVDRLLDRLSHRANRRRVTMAIEGMRTPAIIFIVTSAILILSSKVFVISGWVGTWVGPLAVMAYVTAFLMLVMNVVDALLDAFMRLDAEEMAAAENADLRSMANRVGAIRQIFVVLAVLLGIFLVVSKTNLFPSIGLSLLASAGALTLIFGFAARHILGNILASLQIALNKSARIGDQLVYDDHLCTVDRINFTYVQLKVWDGTRLIVPVSEFVSRVFENWSIVEMEMIRKIYLRLHHHADVQRIREFFEQIVAEDEEKLGTRYSLEVDVTDHDAFSKEVLFMLPCPDPGTAWAFECRVREKLIAACAEHERESGEPMFPSAAALAETG